MTKWRKNCLKVLGKGINLIVIGVLFLTSNAFLYAQAIDVVYQKKIELGEKIGKCPKENFFRCYVVKRIVNTSTEVLENYKYSLLVDNNRSSFKVMGIESRELIPEEINAFKMIVPGHVYTDKKEVYRFKNYQGTDYLLTYDMSKIQWRKTKISKKIVGKTCYKATTTRKNISGQVEEITAWYAPNMNVSAGPSIYGGLPGVILELKIKSYFHKYKVNAIFKAMSLLENKTHKEIIIPQGEVMTAKEYDQMVVGNMK